MILSRKSSCISDGKVSSADSMTPAADVTLLGTNGDICIWASAFGLQSRRPAHGMRPNAEHTMQDRPAKRRMTSSPQTGQHTQLGRRHTFSRISWRYLVGCWPAL